MTEPAFQPLFPNHAIERCAVTFAFQSPLPNKLFAALKDDHGATIQKAGFRPQTAQGVNIDAATGKVTAGIAAFLPVVYTSADSASALIVAPNSVMFQTTRYIRWRQFEAGLELLAFPLVERFLGAVNGASLRLEYTDCFLWPGSWDDFDSTLLLGQSSEFVCREAQKSCADWHSNCGWLEDNGDFRHIKNVNIAAVARPGRDGAIRPAVVIYTLDQEQKAPGAQGDLFDNKATVLSKLSKLHSDLKALLAKVITSDMSDIIGLNLP
jgi:uncharacterized protein (TIGR04255 family)